MHQQWMVFYDGYCNLCSLAVKWIVRNDAKKRFTLKPLQEINSGASTDNTMVLMLNGKVYIRSAAVLRIAVRLRFPWPLMVIFFIVPRFLRDPVYGVVARNRKRWFGERNTCYIP